MSTVRSVLITCDAPPWCGASFTAGTTNARVTWEAAEEEGWATADKPTGPDYCPRHAHLADWHHLAG